MAHSPAQAASAAREPRGARRRRETRTRLLAAALRLMAERGMEGVAINDITEAADVGFGSFYNHFTSKEALYRELVESVFEEFADSLDRLLADVDDPAEVISASVRHTIMRALREPVWGQFLIRQGFTAGSVEQGLGRRLFRDIERGIAARRFPIADKLMSFVAVSGTVLASIAFASPNVRLFRGAKHLPERCAAMVLKTLGVDEQEADKIARRPLAR